MGLYEWLTRKDGHAKSAFIGGSNSPVAKRLVAFMETYKRHAPRFEGMCLKLYKFHILKKWHFYICLYGSPLNIDSSMCEHGHFENLKQVGRNTQQRAATICEQTALQYYEKCLLSRVAMLCMVFKMISKYTRDQIIAETHSRDEEACKTNLAVNGDDDERDHEELTEEEIHVACNAEEGSRITTKGPYFRISFDYSDDGESSKIRMQWLKKKGGTLLADQSEKRAAPIT